MAHPFHKKNAQETVRTGVHIARGPGRFLSYPIQRRLAKRGWKHRVFDVVVVGALAIVIGWLLWIFVIHADPGRQLDFQATIAPEDIVSGGASTLSIEYTNRSNKTLEGATLTLAYPPYFVLQEVVSPDFAPQTNTIVLGNLAPGAHGLTKIRGVLFGNVGGTQTFSATLGYTWGGLSGRRDQTFTFSPQRSALEIRSSLQDQLVAGQRVFGELALKNTGPVTFPKAAIRAVFPDGFILRETSQKQRADKTWIVPSLEPDEELTITFSGTVALKEGESTTFTFEPSFVFDSERFTQEALTETVALVPSPLTVTLTDVPSDLFVSEPFTARVTWSNQTNLDIRDVTISIDGAANAPEWHVDTPVIAGEREVKLIPGGLGTNRAVTLRPSVSFTLNATGERITVLGVPVERKLTTLVALEGFARYFSAAGDQLGRGPLPPTVGQDTTYWIILNIQNTTNPLRDVVVTATLPPRVQWTDQQSVTQGRSVTYTPSTRTVEWILSEADATLGSGYTAAASIALDLTPTAQQLGTTPDLLTNIELTATDAWTGARVEASAADITTEIEEDGGVVR